MDAEHYKKYEPIFGACRHAEAIPDDPIFDLTEDCTGDYLLKKRCLGCLLGGAVGDALGYPIEFKSENQIHLKYGANGIQTLEQAGSPALISDDTQMTLFCACSYVASVSFEEAYMEWLGTQGDPAGMADPKHPKCWIYADPRMHHRRAPGNTCINSLHLLRSGQGRRQANNNSKGCGTVMRAAPHGLFGGISELNGVPNHAMRVAMMDAAFTHGHKSAMSSSELLTAWISIMMRGQADSLEAVIQQHHFPSINEETIQAVEKAIALSHDTSLTDLEGIHLLGEGWVAEEALSIAAFCALRHPDDFAAAVRAAVNHRGDSDSTGAICGNLMGAWLGEQAVADAFDLNYLELRDLIERVANQLYRAAVRARERNCGFRGLRYTNLTRKAMNICFEVHKERKAQDGTPYVFYLHHLAEQMCTEDEICAVLLSEVAENSEWTMDALKQEGFPQSVLDALAALKPNPGEQYLSYIGRLRRNPIARKVKLEDVPNKALYCVLGGTQPETASSSDPDWHLRYQMAEKILQGLNDEALWKVIAMQLPCGAELRLGYGADLHMNSLEITDNACSLTYIVKEIGNIRKLAAMLPGEKHFLEELAELIRTHEVGAFLQKHQIPFSG